MARDTSRARVTPAGAEGPHIDFRQPAMDKLLGKELKDKLAEAADAKAKELKAKAAELKQVAGSSIEGAKQRVATDRRFIELREGASASLASASSMLPAHLLGRGDAAGGSDELASDEGSRGGRRSPADEATAEKERLVDGGSSSVEDKLRAGLAAATSGLGSRLSQSRDGVSSLLGGAKSLGSQTLDGARSAGSVGMERLSKAKEVPRLAPPDVRSAPPPAAASVSVRRRAAARARAVWTGSRPPRSTARRRWRRRRP